MVYEYKCECGNIDNKELSMKDNIPKIVICSKCGKEARRLWGNSNINIPEFLKATSEMYNSNHGNNFDYIKNRMNKGVRPSGKEKVYY